MRSRKFYEDAAAVFLGCVLFIIFAAPSNIVQMLLVFIIGMSCILAAGGKFLFASEIIFPMLSLFLPEAVMFIPAAVHSAAYQHHRLPMILGTAILCYNAVESGSSSFIIFSAVLTILSAFLGIRSAEIARLDNKLKNTRDNDEELQMALRQKNRDLLRKQDDEVNIATLKERNRIAREIHDNVGHLLSRALLQSGALLAVTDKEKMELQYMQTEALKETLTNAMNSIRESVHGLRDDSIDLHNAVKEAVEPVRNRFNVNTDLDFSEKMPPKVKLCFIGIIKEALSNAVKHSNGNEIHIVIREHPAFYQLFIRDNGSSTEIKQSGGMGLSNMRERAESLGGIFQIDSSDGFKIFISVRREREA